MSKPDNGDAQLASGDVSELASSLRIGVMRLERRLRAQRASEGLSMSQLSVLGDLDRKGPLSPTQLAGAERVQPPSMTRIIAGLEDLGLVQRHPHATDGRQSVIDLTGTGRDLLAEDRCRRQAWLACRLDELSPSKRAVLRAALPIIQEIVDS
jgi:DNA-binding MarR family transcriptional regulator